MKRLIIFLLLFAAIKVAGQTTGYLRFDTVMIHKVGGSAELVLLNKTKDTVGVLTNYGNGRTRFMKSRAINDSTIVVGLDTMTIRGGGGASKWEYDIDDNLVNKSFPGSKIEINKRLSGLDSGYVFTGSASGTNPGEGTGVKTFWHPVKGAWRNGISTFNAFDDSQIGLYSLASGYDARAPGLAATALGIGPYVSGQAAIGFGGAGVTVPGNNALGGGLGSVAGGAQSVALGNSANSPGANSVAIGFNPASNGENSGAFNSATRANAKNSFAINEGNDVNAVNGFSAGQFNATNLSWVVPQFVIGRFSDTTISAELVRVGWGSHVGGPKANIWTLDTLGHMRITRPLDGDPGTDSVLVWDNTDKKVKKVAPGSGGGGGSVDSTEVKDALYVVLGGAKDTINWDKNLPVNGLDEKMDLVDYYIDGVGGNDANAGTEQAPKLTLGNVQGNFQGLMNHYLQARLGLKRKSLFREKLTVDSGAKVGGYGLRWGDSYVPEITAYDPAGAWTDTAGIYKQLWDHDIPINQGGYHYIVPREGDTALLKSRPLGGWYYMNLATSIANCIATPGTYFVGPLDRDPITVYVHPSDGTDPDANGYRYELTKRAFTIDATTGGTVASGAMTRLLLERLRLTGNGHGYGTVGAGDSTIVRYCILEGCGTHHMVLNSGWIDRSLLWGQPKGLAQSNSGIVFYEGSAGGNRSAVTNFIALDNPTPVYAHNSGPASSWHKEVAVKNSYLFADTTTALTAMGFDLVEKVVVDGVYAHGFRKAFAGLAREYVVRNSVFNRISERTGLTYPLDSTARLYFDNSFLMMQGDATGAGMYGIYLNRATFYGTITNSILHSKADSRAGANNNTFLVGDVTTQDQFTSYRNIFVVDETGAGQTKFFIGDKQSSGTPYVHNYKGDYNVFIVVRGQGDFTLLNNGGAPNITFAQWQTQTGQDQNSFYRQVWDLDEVFIDAENGNYNLANNPLGDSIRAINAGMLTPPRYFPRKPTPDEAWATINEPGSIADNWMDGTGSASGSGSTAGITVTGGTDITVTGTGNPYVVNYTGAGGSTDTTRKWHVSGNNLGSTGKLGALTGHTTAFISHNILRAGIRAVGGFFVGDSVGLTSTRLVSFKNTSELQGIDILGSISGVSPALNIQTTNTATANNQALVGIAMSPTLSNGGFTGVSARLLDINPSFPSAAVQVRVGNIGAGGTANIVTSDALGTTSMASDGLFQTSAAFGILRNTSSSNMLLFQVGTGLNKMEIDSSGVFIGGFQRPTARLEIIAGQHWKAPLKFQSGNLLATPQVGAYEFLTDKFYGTITTGAARKEFTLNDIALTAGRIPFATTNGRLTDDATFQYDLTNFMLRFGSTSSNPGLQANGSALRARLGDNSDYTYIEALGRAYSSSYNGSARLVTEDAMWDKIETLGGGGITSINSETGSAITIAGGNGLTATTTTNTVTLTLGGTLSGATNVAGGGNSLNLGTGGSKVSTFAAVASTAANLVSDARISLLGNITYQAVFHNSDANHSLAANTQILQLATGSLTTNRTITLPSASTHGQTLTIVVGFASSGNHYVLSSAINDIKTGSTFTQLEWATTYDLMVDNTLNWAVIRKY